MSQALGVPRAVGRLEDGREAVGGRLVRAHQTEALRVPLDHVAQEGSEHTRRLAHARGGGRDVDRVGAKVGQLEVAQQEPAVGVRIGAHAPLAGWRERGELLAQGSGLIEELLRAVRAHPRLELR